MPKRFPVIWQGLTSNGEWRVEEMAERKSGKELYLFLKKRCPNCSGANVEIIIKSKTFIKTETGREEYDFKR